jgi:uncharacterized repeat protein (TIGR01451 family)
LTQRSALARFGFACGLGAALLWAPDAHSAGAPAGTQINNTAEVRYTVGATNVTTNSNAASVTVAEVVDVVVTLQSATVTTAAGATNQALVYRVTNTGNGSEAFLLTMTSVLGGDDFDPTAATPAIYFDTDNNGVLSAGDTAYTPGANDPVLAADAFATILVVNDIPAALANGAQGFSRLTGAARTGTGSAGTVYAGQGAGGTDAVIGATGGDSDATGTYLVSDVRISAVKTATVADPFGGTQPVPGARITYQIVVTATGTGSAGSLVVTDVVPANTSFVGGSLRLNGATLTDTSGDADAGAYVTTPSPRVQFTLGSLSQASGPQTTSFVVTIN